MTLPPVFVNGKCFPFCAKYASLVPGRLPPVLVKMKRGFCFRSPFLPLFTNFAIVTGKMDTGADLTVLTQETAALLGIGDIRTGPDQDLGTAKKNEKIVGYRHRIFVQLPWRSSTGKVREVSYAVEAVFSAEVTENLFGCDWLQYMCLGVNHQTIHFLAE